MRIGMSSAMIPFLLLQFFLIYSVIIFVTCSQQENRVPAELSEAKKQQCNKEEVFLTCGTSCPDTCDNYGKPRICTQQCVADCFCRQGMVRDRNFRCIRPEQCERVPGNCGKDETFYTCTPSCKNTCVNYNNPGIRCACGPPGCFCKEGLVKNDRNGQCVEPKNCPGSPPRHGHCGVNEEVVYCAKPKWCNTCGIRGNCKLTRCEPGCDCKKGYYRDEKGICIHESMCSGNEFCGLNEEYKTCGSACPPTCENINNRNFACPTVCSKGCFCKEGFIREKRGGRCIPVKYCPKTCGTNEVHSRCVIPCNDCLIKGKCNFLLCNEGCDCIAGHYRDEKGICIPEALCPKCLYARFK